MAKYAPIDVSKLLEIPDSTLRRFARDFKDYLSPQKGRKRQYSDRDLSTLREIRGMFARGMTTAQIKTQLDNVVDLEPEPAETEDSTHLPIVRQLAQLDKQYNDLTQEIEKLRSERQADQDRLRALEDRINSTWFQRLFKRRKD